MRGAPVGVSLDSMAFFFATVASQAVALIDDVGESGGEPV